MVNPAVDRGQQTLKQVLQHLRSGQIELADVPCPMVRPGHLLIQTARSLISAGTERMLVEFGRAGIIAKARLQPEKVRQVLNKIKTDGLLPTLDVVFSRLEEPMPLGYCNVGRVVEVGPGVEGFRIGDRVASNGPHAEMVCVPATLAARVPEEVPDEAAAFTVLGSIALHGVRLLQPTLGERFVVTGLGLIGLVGVQLLRAHGCDVLGLDTNVARCELAGRFGCRAVAITPGNDPLQAALAFSRDRGVDGVLITAATKSNEPMRQAARMCRKRGRIVSTGNVGLDLERGALYERELSVQVSCAYGPGRYDPVYEGRAQDYPYPYVRWTAGRNFEAVLDAMARGQVDVHPLISRTVAHGDAPEAYDAILNDSSVLGVVLTYPEQAPPVERVVRLQPLAARASQRTTPVVGLIGAGGFAKLVTLPAIRAAGVRIRSVADVVSASGFHAARKFGAEQSTTDYRELLADPEINTVFITTPHNLHAPLVAEALEAGKHVFVEKPLAVDEEGLERVRQAQQVHPELQLMVGFNRRFAPHTKKVKELLTSRSQPLALEMMVNAGYIPPEHWVHDPVVGGGRIIGEGCHFVDLLMHLVGRPVTSVQAVMFGTGGRLAEDKTTIIMSYADGSIGTVHYWANGPKSYPKERVEVFTEGRVLVIDNWRRLRAFSFKGAPAMRIRQNKGHRTEIAEFLRCMGEGGNPLIPFAELELVTRVTFAAMRSARDGNTIRLSSAGNGLAAPSPES